jgi:signal transduction histidine kinase
MGWDINGLVKDMSKLAIVIILVIVAISAGIILCLWVYLRKQYIEFTEEMCDYVERLISDSTLNEHVEVKFGEAKLSEAALEEETLDSKMKMKLKQLADVTNATKSKNIEQKQQMQEMVSDISHQLKTPIANITMYNDTILNHELSNEKKLECLKIMQNQVEKLDFLVKSLMKMSRLENNIITLKKEQCNLYDSIAEVLASVNLRLEKKKLTLSVDCKNPYQLAYDEKWTIEAIFNVVDNAVKYTPEGGKLDIYVERLEMFTKICVQDTGVGIAAEHMNDIFKRFFRESKVHREEGVGIGLYLTREILTQQGGFIKVASKEGEGSVFSLYLPN